MIEIGKIRDTEELLIAPDQDSKIVSMIRKYHNHKPQTNPWQREKELHNHHETPGRQTLQNNQHSLPHQYDCKTRMGIK